MLLSLWMMSQFALLTLLLAIGTSLPQSPALTLALGAAGLLALAPMLTCFVWSRRDSLTLTPQPGERKLRPTSCGYFGLPQDPGTHGQARPRAPTGFAVVLG